MTESKGELQSFLMKVKEESEKVGLKLNIKESLHPWDKAHLVMVYDLFNVLLDSDC